MGQTALFVEHVALGGNSDEGSQCIEEVNKEEGEDHGKGVEGKDRGEIHFAPNRQGI